MALDKVRLGIIGTGGMGSGHCKAASKLVGAELTAICDIDPEVRETTASTYNVPGFATSTELINSGLVDAVTIATPHYFHPPIAIEAFKAGLHVLSEKPIAVTVSAADAMIAAAKESGKKFAVMFQRRSEVESIAARKIIESGALGEIYRTSLYMCWYRSQAYYNSGGWRATWAGEGGGVLINQAPHALDLFTWLGGLPTKVTGQIRTRLHDIEVEDEAFATLEYANGAHGYIYLTTNEIPQKDTIEILGDKGKLTLDGSKITFTRVSQSIKEFTKTNTVMWAGLETEDVPVELPPAFEPGGHTAISQNFVNAILHDEPLMTPGEIGLNAVELINSMILSSKSGKTVNLPVNRTEYDKLIEELKATSKQKTNVQEQRVTDPNHV